MKYDNITKILTKLSIISIILQPIVKMPIFYLITFLNIFFIVLKIIKDGKLTLNSYDVIFIIFICLCFFSKLYAISQPTANYTIKEVFFAYIISFSIGEYINQKSDKNIEKKFLSLLNTFSLSTTAMSIYLLIFDLSRVLGTRDRLGRLLFQNYGTYIVFSYSLIIALCYTLWKIIYIKKDKKSIIELIILFITSCLSGTRKVLVCFIIFSILIFMFKYKKNIFKIFKLFFIGSIVIIVLYNLLITNENLYKIMGSRVENMVESIFNNNTVDHSINERTLLKKLAISAFKEKPILGWGVNNFVNYSSLHGGPSLYAHCNYLELLSTLGIIGTTVYYSGYIWLMIKSHKYLKKDDKISILIFFFLIMNLFSDYETVSYCKIHYILVFILFAKYLNQKEVQYEKNN